MIHHIKNQYDKSHSHEFFYQNCPNVKTKIKYSHRAFNFQNNQQQSQQTTENQYNNYDNNNNIIDPSIVMNNNISLIPYSQVNQLNSSEIDENLLVIDETNEYENGDNNNNNLNEVSLVEKQYRDINLSILPLHEMDKEIESLNQIPQHYCKLEITPIEGIRLQNIIKRILEKLSLHCDDDLVNYICGLLKSEENSNPQKIYEEIKEFYGTKTKSFVLALWKYIMKITLRIEHEKVW